MKLLVGVVKEKDAIEALKGGCDIIDIKNPIEGSIGANFPSVIRKVREVVPKNFEISACIGDMPNLPGTASLAALGAASCNVNYIKVGLKGAKTKKEAIYLVENVVKTVKGFDKSKKVAVSVYGDYKRAKTLNPMLLPEVVYRTGADVTMLDTTIKDGKIFDFLEIEQLKEFVEKSHKLGLLATLAGSLGKEDVELVSEAGADILGVRGSVCDGDRIKGGIKSSLVRELVEKIRNLS
jgi:hypothetical protein